ncbi:N-acetyltransferase [Sulfitobacter sp. S190]|uniref:GNAT family N-acetyltransferase n=1 Tax=Sulfitobacter sp. S190 TaxID=2867022 RepID=UPI0021A7073F|nr:GNAT family N-acetyltransferase [Sulfitobacter sp. S190]UWR22746.1 GNAT family N-acetyltransferase [Sulfitobacter sp. S190]
MLADGFHDVAEGKLAMVVTHLEMHAKPDVTPMSLPQGVAFRKVSPTLEWYRDVFMRVGSLEWLWFGRMVLDDAALTEILNDPKVAFYTLSRDGQDEALLELDFRQDAECELAYFGLTPKLIGSGSGRFLMNQAIDLAWSNDIERFHVHTCTIDSPQAVNFYIRSGFTPYRRQVEVADDPRVTGVLPREAAAWIPII